jgi:transposase, IS5 family
LARVVADTTVQPKAVMFPTDAKLLNRTGEIRQRSGRGKFPHPEPTLAIEP